MENSLINLIKNTFDIEYLFKKTKETDYVIARSVFFYVNKTDGKRIADMTRVSRLNHATVINSIKNFEIYYNQYEEYKHKIDYVMANYKGIKFNDEKLTEKLIIAYDYIKILKNQIKKYKGTEAIKELYTEIGILKSEVDEKKFQINKLKTDNIKLNKKINKLNEKLQNNRS